MVTQGERLPFLNIVYIYTYHSKPCLHIYKPIALLVNMVTQGITFSLSSKEQG